MIRFTRCCYLHQILRKRLVFRSLCFFTTPSFKLNCNVFESSFLCKFCAAYKTTSSFHTSTYLWKKPKLEERPKGDRRLKYDPKIKSKLAGEDIKIWKNMTVEQLANAMGKDVDHVFEIMIYIKETNDYDSPSSAIDNMKVLHEIVKKSGLRAIAVSAPEAESEVDVELTLKRPLPDRAKMIKRPPVVTIMGHVDHGKTTLLDSLRHSSIVSGEFGGITQHIGAFSVKVKSGETVTFLDTPGHAAFSAMRARGASVTDVVVLVVAADDGVMQQTVESIRFAKEAKVPIIVAINKIDKNNADVGACKKGLLQSGIQLEDFSGEVQSVPISALKGTNLDVLVEAILTQAEMMDLKGDPKGLVEGAVVESRVDNARGKLCTAIIQRGTLRKGSVLVGGLAWAKVRSMLNEHGQPIQLATPSTPVEILGWKDLPNAGDEIYEVESEKRARAIIEARLEKKKLEKINEDDVIIQEKMEQHTKLYREEREQRLREGRYRKKYAPRQKEIQDDDKGPELLIVLKGDVDGSVDAILDCIDTYHSQLCNLEVIHFGVGAITENDVEMAAAFNAIVYGFNTTILKEAQTAAKKMDVVIKEFNIIYRLIDNIKEQINDRLPMKKEEQILGEAEVVQEFVVNENKKKWPVAGSRCIKGVLKKSANFRLKRADDILFEGSLTSMRHLKNEVDSIKKNVECGLRVGDPEIRFQQGDVIQCYEMVDVSQKLEWDPGF